MIRMMRNVLGLSRIDNPDERRISSIMVIFSIVIFVAILPPLIMDLIAEWYESVIALSAECLVILAVLLLIRKRKTAAAGNLLLFSLLIVVSYVMYEGWGIRGVGVFCFPGFLIVGGLILSRTSYIVLTVTCMLSLGLMSYLEANQLVTTRFSHIALDRIHYDYVVILIVTAFGVSLISKHFKDNVRRLREQQSVLMDRKEKSAEQARQVELSEALWSSLVYNSPDTIMQLKPEGSIEFVNHDNSGFQAAERESILDLVKPDRKEVFKQALQYTSQIQTPTEHELQLGEAERWYAVRVIPFKDHQEVSLLLLATDVTDHKQNEMNRKKLEQKMQQAQRLDSISTLATGIAHDFNNILAIITAYASSIRTEFSMHESESLNAIVAASEKAAGIVRQMSTFTLEQDVDFRAIDMVAFVEELVRELQLTMPPDLIMRFESTTESIYVAGDVQKVHQALLNLCLNARDAMDGQGVLRLSLDTLDSTQVQQSFATEDADKWVKITVTDTGEGMDEPTRERIFEPFFTTKGRGKGTGLGLAMVSGIVKTHRGHIEVQSKPGEGTSFHLYLPRIEAPQQEESAAETDELKGGTEKILLVEDEETLRSLYERILSNYGYEVISCDDGAEAYDLFLKDPGSFDLVLTDMDLPGLDGIELINRIHDEFKEIKIILMSGSFEVSHRKTFVNKAYVSFLRKPSTMDRVLRTIRTCLDDEVTT